MAHPKKPVSVHIRVIATWIVIFPLVALGLTFLGPALGPLHPVLKAFILTIIIVPLAVYFFVPNLLAFYEKITEKKSKETSLNHL